MFAVVGAAGSVGYATSRALREAGKPVRAILRDAAKAALLREIGCEITLADLQDSKVFAEAIAGADAVQIVIPLSLQATDPAEDLRQSIESVVAALALARPKRVLAISDYGAHVADDIGMPSIFHNLETQLAGIDAHKVVLRSAEHMHNWARVIPVAIASGKFPTFHTSLDENFPVIAAPDLGRIAADLLLRPASEKVLEIVHAEGPRRYSANDVASALSRLSGRAVSAASVPRAQWKNALGQMSPSLAELLIKANDAQNKGGLVDIEPNVGEVCCGSTELIDALRPLVPPH